MTVTAIIIVIIIVIVAEPILLITSFDEFSSANPIPKITNPIKINNVINLNNSLS